MVKTTQPLFIITALSGLLLLGACASNRPTVTFPPEVQQLEHQPVFDKDDATLRLGKRPVYALLEQSPDRTWKVLQLSNRFMKPGRANREVVEFNETLTNAYPAWTAGTYEFNTDPLTGKRTDIRINAVASRKVNYRDRPSRAGANGYGAFNSSFGTEYYTSNVVGNAVHAVMYYSLNQDAFRSAIASTDLIAKGRAYQAGDRTFASTPTPVKALSIGEQIWAVTPKRAEKDRFYFLPATFISEDEDVVDEGSDLNVSVSRDPVPWVNIKRMNAYETSTIPAYQSLPKRTCSHIVFDIAGKGVKQDGGTCAEGVGWKYSFMAKSPSLGRVRVISATGRQYTPDGLLLASRSLHLDNEQQLDIRVLTPEEAAAVRKTLR